MNYTDNYLAKYISLIHRQAAAFLTKEFNKFGFGAGQYMFMIHLYKNDGISQEALSDLLNIDKGTTAKAIKKLEELQFVTRCKDSNDKRINRVFLTEKSYEIKDEFFEVLAKWENTLTKGLNEKELNEGLKLLEKLSTNVIVK